MKISNCEELKKAIDLYLLKCDKQGKEELLNEIRTAITTIEGAREQVLKELEKKQRYIRFFSTEDQIEIIWDTVKQINDKHHMAYDAHWLLIYASDEAKKRVLYYADELTIRLIMKDIEGSINVIGHRFCDSSYYSTVFSRMWEKRQWRKLYRLCEKNLYTKPQ